MPGITRAQLVSKKDLSLDQLAELADDICLSQATLNNLVAEAVNDHLVEKVNEVRNKPATESKKPNNSLCWNHKKWGKEARGCKPPCRFKRLGNRQ